MSIRSDVHLLCTGKIHEELKIATASAADNIKPQITPFGKDYYFKWEFIKWDRSYYTYCQDVYSILEKYEDNPNEGYKLIRFGEEINDSSVEFNTTGEELFGWFVPIRTVSLPNASK